MREGWQIRKLGDVCSVRRDSSIHTGMNYVGLEHISSGNGVLVSLADTSGVIGTTNLFNAGDVLYGKLRPYLKKVIVADCDGCCSTEILPIRCNGDILPDFLKYWFLEDGITDRINATCGGCRMPRANMKDVFQFAFSFPSLPEQQRIVDILDREFAKIDALKVNAEKSLQAAKDLFQTTLKKELEPKEGWKTTTLGQSLKLTSGDNLTAKNLVSGPFPVYGGNGIMGYHNQYNLDGQNLIVGRVGALCGNVRLVSGKIWYTDNAFLVHDKQNAFYLPFLSLVLTNANLRQFATQAAQPVVSNASMKDARLSFPEAIEEQKRIVPLLNDLNDKCNILQENYQKTLTLSDDLKQSLLHKAFNGEL